MSVVKINENVNNENFDGTGEQPGIRPPGNIREELKNAKSLFLIKAKNARRGFIVFLFIAVGMLISSMIIMARYILSPVRSDTALVTVVTTIDFSIIFYCGLLIGIIIAALLYRKSNDTLTVFPQTNDSRWLSSQLLNYAIALGIGLIVLVMFLVNYAYVGILSLSGRNIHFGFDFDIGYTLAGLMTFLVYSFLFIALVELVGTIARKWAYISGAVFSIAAALAFTNLTAVFDYAPKALSFLIYESSFGLFLLKAAGCWLAMVAVSYLINHNTVYFKSKGEGSKKRGMIFGLACITAVGVFTIGMTIYKERNYTYTPPAPVSEPEAVIEDDVYDDYWTEYLERMVEVRIDVSHLPRGSEIKKAENDNFLVYDARFLYWNRDDTISISDLSEDPLTDLQGDTLVVLFAPPYMEIYGIEILGYLNAEYSVELIDDTLYFDYTAEDAGVVFIQMWQQLMQFDFAQESGRFSGGGIWINIDAPSGWFEGISSGYNFFNGIIHAYTAVE